MQKRLLPLILACLTATAAAVADEPEVIFGPKEFVDRGDTVHVEGTLVGERVGYKNNRIAVTCYHQMKQCLVVRLQSSGMQVSSIGWPTFYTVRVWAADRTTADLSAPCGNPPGGWIKEEWQAHQSFTLILDRTRQTAEQIDHLCVRANPYHWMIEDPPYRKEQKKQ